jgi:hypothetical protein
MPPYPGGVDSADTSNNPQNMHEWNRWGH